MMMRFNPPARLAIFVIFALTLFSGASLALAATSAESIQFTNTNPRVLSILEAEGFVAPANKAGVATEASRDVYLFEQGAAECAGVLSLEWRTTDKLAATVPGAQIIAYRQDGEIFAPQAFSQVTTATSSENLVVRGGSAFQIEVIYPYGVDRTGEPATLSRRIAAQVPCDGIVPLRFEVPSFGQVHGEADVVRSLSSKQRLQGADVDGVMNRVLDGFPNPGAVAKNGEPGAGQTCADDEFAGDALGPEWTVSYLGDADNGSAVVANGRLQLSGNGTSLYHGTDNAIFAHQTVTADFRAEVVITDVPVDTGGDFRKLGIQARFGLGPSAPRVFAQLVTNHPTYNTTALQFDYRGVDGVARELASTPVNLSLPLHLAIDRRGDLFTVYFSNDGGNSWLIPAGAAGGQITIAGGPDVNVGVSVSSYDAATLMTGEFDDFSICRPLGTDIPIPPPPVGCQPGRALNVAYLFDNSGSMTDVYPGADSKLDAARNAIYAMNSSLATSLPGSAAALVTFSGNRDPDFNLNSSVKIRSGLTTDLALVDQAAAAIDVGAIDPASSTPLAIAFARTLDDLLIPEHDNTKIPVVVLLTDTVPNVDRSGNGPLQYRFNEVSAISLYDDQGDFRSQGSVSWSGGYNGSLDTYDGKVLGDVMSEIHRMKAALPDTLIFGIAIQGGEQFREDLMEYAAYYTSGSVFSVDDSSDLLVALQQLVSSVDCGSTIGDRVWHDLDGNGEQNTGEPGISGVLVELLDAGGAVVDSMITDNDGIYMFEGLAPGTYTVRIQPSTLSGSVRMPTADADGTDTPHTTTFTLAEGEDRTDLDFGYEEVTDTSQPGCRADDFEDGVIGSEWMSTSIGDDNQGSVSENGGRLQVSSDGTELYHGDDNGYFIYQSVTGDFRAEVTITGFPVDEGGNHRKGGLTFRSSMATDAARVMVMVEPSFNGGGPAVLFDARTADGAVPVEMGSTLQGLVFPIRVMIEKRNGEISVGMSPDGGLTWVTPAGGLGGSATIPDLDGTGQIGMMAASYSPVTVMTVELDDFEICQPDTEQPPDPGPDSCDPTLPLDVIYVLDQSGSMTWEFPGDTSKFQASKAALKQLNTTLSTFNNGSRAALVTFSGKNDVTFNLNSAVKIRSGLTDDFDFLDEVLGQLNMNGIPWQATTPVPLTLDVVRDLLIAEADPGRLPVVVKLSDSLPNIDIDGEGPEEYPLDALQAIPLKDGGGDWLAPGIVDWAGSYNGSTGTYSGKPLADNMRKIQEIAQSMTNARMFGITLVGDGMGLGTYSFDLDQYAAYYTNGEARIADNADDLTIQLISLLQGIYCGEEGLAVIGDRVWNDANGNGVQDPDENGIGGVTVNLVDVNGTVVGTAVTENTGGYLFVDVPEGTYAVNVDPSTLPANLDQPTFDYDGTATPHTATVTVIQYQVILEADFGYESGDVDPGDPVVGCVEDDFDGTVLGSAWQTASIGNADQGAATLVGGELHVTGDGTGMFADDHAFFVYRNVNNEAFRMEVDVLGSDEGGATIYQKTGLAVRAGLGSLAPRVYVQYQPLWPDARGSLQFRYRSTDGADGGSTWASSYIDPTRPVRLAIAKNGDTYTAEFSQDGGTTWIQPPGGVQGEVTIDMGDALLAGITSTSYSADTTLTGYYDNFGLCAEEDPDGGGVVVEDRCVDTAESSVYSGSGGHAVWLPGIAKDLIFYGTGGMVEYADGTATLTGTVLRESQTDRGFEVEITLTDRSDTALHPQSPKKELNSGAYVPNGPADPADWYYYNAFTATLTGVGEWAGAIVEVTQRGPDWQMGIGANNKNLDFGASAWLDYNVVQQPTTGVTLQSSGKGDFNLSLECPEATGEYCVTEAWGDQHSSSGNHAIAMPGVARDMLFTTTGGFEELDNDGAILTGTAYKKDDPAKSFDVVVNLQGRTTSPPAGSPKLELPGGAYFPGGPADPSTWWYYTSFVATFTGQGDWDGAVVSITQRGPAWQLGIGASNKNVDFGMSAWFDYEVVEQPTTGVTLQSSGNGDFNLNIYSGSCPDGTGGGGDDGGGDDGGGDDGGGGDGGGDDTAWCPRTPGFWKNHTIDWNSDSLELGGTVYSTADLLYFLGYGGPDMSLKLARSLVATKLNLLEGSDPTAIQQSVDDSDAFLADSAPGSNPSGADKTLSEALKDDLDGYNNNNIGCADGDDAKPDDSRGFGRTESTGKSFGAAELD